MYAYCFTIFSPFWRGTFTILTCLVTILFERDSIQFLPNSIPLPHFGNTCCGVLLLSSTFCLRTWGASWLHSRFPQSRGASHSSKAVPELYVLGSQGCSTLSLVVNNSHFHPLVQCQGQANNAQSGECPCLNSDDVEWPGRGECLVCLARTVEECQTQMLPMS